MKISAKKYRQDGKKTVPKIQNYFKPTSKPLIDDKTSESEATKAFYIQVLKKKLEKSADESKAVTEAREEIENEVEPLGATAVVMEKEISEPAVVSPISKCTGCNDWETKYKSIKKSYMKLGTHYAELRLKYEDLLNTKTYTHTNPSDINDPVSTSDAIFTSGEIMVLQSMALDKKTDSTFILKSLQYAYKNDLSVLLTKTLNGKPEAMKISDNGEVEYLPGKDPLSPQKIKRIRELFIERIIKCNLNPADNEERLKDSHMNKLIATGITNIGRKAVKES